jgi:peptide/nickel transport system permease protein
MAPTNSRPVYGVYTDDMLAFLVRRVVLGFLVLVVLSLGSFCFFAWQDPRLSPVGVPHPSLLAEYWTWLKGLGGGASSDMLLYATAPTRLNRQPTTMLAALGHTTVLLALALALVVVLSIALSLVAASRRGSALDVTLRALSYLAWAVPAFLLALLVQVLANSVGGTRGIGSFPLAGWPGSCPTGLGVNAGILTPCPAAGTGVRYALNVARYVTLPAATLAVGFVGLHARYLRSALLEVLDAPFITTARAKGLRERTVLVRHALRASLVTFVGALLADFGAVFGSAMAVDYVFQLNGLGTVFMSEFPVDFGFVDTYSIEPVLLLTAVLIIVSSIVADLAILWLDPRVREVK